MITTRRRNILGRILPSKVRKYKICRNRASLSVPKTPPTRVFPIFIRRRLCGRNLQVPVVSRADRSRPPLALHRLPLGFSSCVFAPIDRAPRTPPLSRTSTPGRTRTARPLAPHEGVVFRPEPLADGRPRVKIRSDPHLPRCVSLPRRLRVHQLVRGGGSLPSDATPSVRASPFSSAAYAPNRRRASHPVPAATSPSSHRVRSSCAAAHHTVRPRVVRRRLGHRGGTSSTRVVVFFPPSSSTPRLALLGEYSRC